MRTTLSRTTACLTLAAAVVAWSGDHATTAAAADRPLSLHPDNPHYFLFRGKPTIMLTSVGQAGKRGIVVELSLFCPLYNDKLWDNNPMKADNNVNGVGKGGRLDVYNLKDRELTKLQEALVRKIVGELKDCDNVYYEICN